MNNIKKNCDEDLMKSENKQLLSETEDGYKSCNSSVSDKTYLLNHENKIKKSTFVTIDIIDYSKKNL